MGNTAYCQCVDVPYDDNHFIAQHQAQIQEQLSKQVKQRYLNNLLTSRIVYQNQVILQPLQNTNSNEHNILKHSSNGGNGVLSPLKSIENLIRSESQDQSRRKSFQQLSPGGLISNDMIISRRVQPDEVIVVPQIPLIPLPNLPPQETIIDYPNGGYFKTVAAIDGSNISQGHIVLPNIGLEYEGQVLGNKPHGFGRERLNGYYYQGYFFDGVKHGRGKLICPNGDIYSGTFENNVLVGGELMMFAKGETEGKLLSSSQMDVTSVEVVV